MNRGRGKKAATLIELVLAVGLLAVALLAVLALAIAAIRSEQKRTDTGTADQVAERQLNRELAAARTDPAFWSFDYVSPPWKEDSVQVDGTWFDFKIYAQTVDNADLGGDLGTASGRADNRLKKVDIVVWWWDSSAQARTGYGSLQTRLSRLVSEQ
ncbi:MAG: hypothetical protein HY319_07155 [Armatimonadetes bacterium]|nr:hypothetical protein [Armatimonadota bacterium]